MRTVCTLLLVFAVSGNAAQLEVIERGERHVITGASRDTPGLSPGQFKVRAVACPPKGDSAFAYHGGKLLNDAQVVVIFWGSQWNAQTRATISDKITRLVHSPYLTQIYPDIHCPASLDIIPDTDVTPPPGADVEAEVLRLINAHKVIDPATHQDNAYLLIAPGRGYSNGFYGWHVWDRLTNGAYVHFGVVDYDDDSQVTQTFSHELTETLSDPRGGGIYDGDCGQRCEIGDACYCFNTVQHDVDASYYYSLPQHSCVLPDGADGCAGPTTGPTGRIVFVSTRDGNKEIYIMNADGTNRKRLTNNKAPDYDPSWSPDGSKIIFVSERDGHPQIYTMNPDGTDQKPMPQTTSEDTQPRWGAMHQ